MHRVRVAALARVMPLSPEYSEDSEALAIQRTEVGVVFEHALQRNIDVVACRDDATLAQQAHGPHVHFFGRDNLVSSGGRPSVRIGAVEQPVDGDLVGESAIYAAIVTVLVEQLLTA